MSYPIKRDYIPFGKSRSGQSIQRVRFIVAHDTGNSGTSAQANVNWFKGNPVNASAHAFIDDKHIIEDVPLTEKAWHVRYNVNSDNIKYGADANDSAIGVELCYGGNIDFNEAYKRYVWYHAYLCRMFNLKPETDIVGHSALDPSRRSDPENALNRYGITFRQFIQDVIEEFRDPMADGYIQLGEHGKVVEVLQQSLMDLGYDLGKYGADGDYGPITVKAVKQFQQNYNLKVDGYYGPNTRQTLGKAIKHQKQKEREERNLAKTGFRDVEEGKYYTEAIKWAREKGITVGKGDGTFGVGEPITREQAIVFLYRALNDK